MEQNKDHVLALLSTSLADYNSKKNIGMQNCDKQTETKYCCAALNGTLTQDGLNGFCDCDSRIGSAQPLQFGGGDASYNHWCYWLIDCSHKTSAIIYNPNINCRFNNSTTIINLVLNLDSLLSSFFISKHISNLRSFLKRVCNPELKLILIRESPQSRH